jgi:hypothetical protein
MDVGKLIYIMYEYCRSVAARSTEYVCGRLSAEIVCSNPAVGMDVFLLRILCVVR